MYKFYVISLTVSFKLYRSPRVTGGRLGLSPKAHTHGFLGVLVVAVLPGEATLNRTIPLLDLILEGIKRFRGNLRKQG